MTKSVYYYYLFLQILLLLLLEELLVAAEEFKSKPTSAPLSATTTKHIEYASEVKDSFLIHPGTRWCGVGTLAMNYTTLGTAYESDMCCREHDHCDRVIRAKRTKYHMKSIFHFTISHCECDVKFYRCLKNAHDSQGASVIEWFFRLIRVPCFDLVPKRVCLESKRVSMFSSEMRCIRYGTEDAAVLRRLPYFTDELDRMRREQGGLHWYK
ncbi:hypothetical protein BOX15_Mlig020249g1 [Macrostomum lignano]|uniref:PA2c domain-containing protein n=2 Tax=Macrostomum lignano TaxID=282301 RepID=A0A1I8H2D8_9PLAT|nr:hypothetical protein BOX15_Mlig020249g1 [Macrostomum lignano]